MTITNKNDARRLLLDDTIVRAWMYTNLLNGLTMFAMFEDKRHDDTDVSPFVCRRRLLKDGTGFTPDGKRLTEGNQIPGYV